jgi:hypothetical protein
MIRKQTKLRDAGKIDEVVLKKEFDALGEAQKFIEVNFKDEFEYSFEFSKEGWEYELDSIRVWVEDVKEYKPSIEVGAEDSESLEKTYDKLGIVEKLNKSLPEIIQEEQEKFLLSHQI